MLMSSGSSRLMRSAAHWRATRITAVSVSAALAGSLLVALPAGAERRPLPGLSAGTTPTVDAVPVTPRSRPRDLSQGTKAVPRPAVWPAAGVAEVAVIAGSGDRRVLKRNGGRTAATMMRAGDLPVWVGPADAAPTSDAGTSAVARARVAVLDRASLPAGWRDSVVVRVARADGEPGSGSVAVGVGYAGFDEAFGADWSSRLRLVALPGCALTTPEVPGCQSRPLPSHNDISTKRVVADLALTGSGASTQGTLVVLTAGASSTEGDYGATPLQPSSTWAAGGSSGGFSWAYPMRMPPSLGGPAPSVTLAYSSASVDGRGESTNNQPSWIGEGFEYWPGFIERRYKPCSLDMGGNANNPTATGDLCWGTDNAVLSLNGSSIELIKDSTSGGWRLRSDDGSRVERLDDTANPADNTVNGAHNNEYWKITTPDGTQYYFGRNRLPGYTGTAPANDTTGSTWTVPVAGNNTDEPCRQPTFIGSFCDQAWRWNLDYVVDPDGNTMSMWYTPQTNSYARNNTDSDAVDYVRGGVLTRIAYGTHNRSGTDTVYTATQPPAQVHFTAADRCLAACWSGSTPNPANWPDTAWDQHCATSATSCPGLYTPTFWTQSRLAQVTTKVWDQSLSPPGYKDVDSWTLTHTLPDPGDGTRAGLWLDTIVHAGHVGGTVTLPEVNFDWLQLPNRVDTIGDTKKRMNWMRMSTIWTETGGKVSVTYTDPDCVAGTRMPTAPESNTLRCYPVISRAAGGGTETDYFHKYLVTQVTEADLTGGGTDVVTRYEYPGTPAWHYTDDDGLTLPAYRTWSGYRGYDRVRVRVGTPGQDTLTETGFFRGMHADKAAPAGGTRTVTLPAVDLNRDGDTTDPGDAPAVDDQDAFAGMTRSTTLFNGVDTDPVSASAFQPWQSAPTATRTIGTDTAYTRYTGTSLILNATELDNERGWRIGKITAAFDDYGMVDHSTDHGDVAISGDEQCADITYARNADLNLLTLMARVQTFALACGQAPTSSADVIADTRTSYDNNAYYDGVAPHNGTPPTAGSPTKVETLKDWSPANGGTTTWLTVGRSSFDAYGRVLDTWDVRNNKTSTTYTPVAGGPVTKVTTTNPLQWLSSVDLEPAWGSPIAAVDVNNKRTDLAYDALGRLAKVWQPNRPKATNPTSPNLEYSYLVRNTGGVNAVTTKTLNADANVVASHTLYDGLVRPRQTQASAVSGGGTIFTETVYDAAGRVWKASGPHHDATLTPGTSLVTLADWQHRTQTVTDYDRAGRPTASILNSAGSERWRTTTGYGGDRVYVTPPTGGTPTTTLTDIRGRTVEVRQHSGGSTSGPFDATGYTYNRKGQLIAVADPAGNTWELGYDLRGRRDRIDDPDRGVTESAFNDYGELTSNTDDRGEKLVYEYDSLGRQIGVYDDVISTATRRASWVYDPSGAKGLLSSSSRWVGSSEYKIRVRGYTPLYQPTGEDYTIPAAEGDLAGTYSFPRGYKLDGSLATTSYPSGGGLGAETLTHTYDPVTGLPEQLDTNWPDAGEYVTNTDYTPFGEVGLIRYQQTAQNWLDRSFVYDDATHRLTKATTARQIAPQILAELNYTYDAAGNITKIADTPAGGSADTQCFRYDHLRRLTEAWTPSSGDCGPAPSTAGLGGPAPYWSTWTFDAIGNRDIETLHAAVGDTVRDYTYPGPGADRPHGVTSIGETGPGGPRTYGYGYDASGNTTSRPGGAGGQTLTWDAEGRLATTSDSTGTTSYLYTAGGTRLISHDATGTTVYLPGTELRLPTGGAVTATRYYAYNGQVSGMRQPGTGIIWLVTDHQGTQSLAIAAGDQTLTQRRQTPYGEPRGASPAWPNPHGFVGGTRDAGTGLTHLGAREYDPEIGRFLSVDPVMDLTDSQQWNSYTYANGSPITMSDPTGLLLSCSGPDGIGCRHQASKQGYSGPGATARYEAARKRYFVNHRKANTWKPLVGPVQREGLRPMCNGFGQCPMVPSGKLSLYNPGPIVMVPAVPVYPGYQVPVAGPGCPTTPTIPSMRSARPIPVMRNGPGVPPRSPQPAPPADPVSYSGCFSAFAALGVGIGGEACVSIDSRGITVNAAFKAGAYAGAGAGINGVDKVSSDTADQVNRNKGSLFVEGGPKGGDVYGGEWQAEVECMPGQPLDQCSYAVSRGVGVDIGGVAGAAGTMTGVNSGYLIEFEAIRNWLHETF